MFRKVLGIVVLSAIGTVLVVGTFLYFKKGPCEEPLTYTIGTIDPRFGVAPETFKKDLTQAIGIWEKALGTPLFAESTKGAVTINLVYDIRQQTTQKEQVLNENISQTSQTADSVRREYAMLKAQYEQAHQAYEVQLAAFNEAQARYNAKVDHWNNAGGAPKEQYDALTAEKNNLLALRGALEQKRQEVNGLADTVNTFIKKYNLLVAYINSNINAINNDGLAGTQFEEGVYVSDENGQRINVYQFVNKTDLIRVLAHELGHALALGHNTNPDSIMNPVNTSESLTVSPEDLRDLKTACGIK
ncbi:MAG: matrixin family metalloprotease [Candidatus Paceibacterota bacterium]|jgi:hypothetical protein